MILTKHHILEEMLTDEQWQQIEEHEPPQRSDRADEAAYLVDVAAFYDWCKAEAADLEEDMLEREWIRFGCP